MSLNDKGAPKGSKRGAHLKQHQFKKGQSGNPGGRPKDAKRMWPIVERLLESKAPTGKTYGEEVIEAYVAQLLKGDMRALKELFDRTDGRPTETVMHEGSGFQVVLRPASPPNDTIDSGAETPGIGPGTGSKS